MGGVTRDVVSTWTRWHETSTSRFITTNIKIITFVMQSVTSTVSSRLFLEFGFCLLLDHNGALVDRNLQEKLLPGNTSEGQR